MSYGANTWCANTFLGVKHWLQLNYHINHINHINQSINYIAHHRNHEHYLPTAMCGQIYVYKFVAHTRMRAICTSAATRPLTPELVPPPLLLLPPLHVVIPSTSELAIAAMSAALP
jgi:hypothetical protein